MFRAFLCPSSGHPTAASCVHCVENVHTACHPTLQHHNSYNRTDKYRQWNAVGSPDDGHKDD